MYCPICRAEYREGFTQCSECDVKLVNDLPLEQTPEYENLVTVFEGDSNSAAVARTMVEGVGIESWAKDEGLHSIFPNLGPTGIEVRVEDEELALEVLETPEHRAHVPHGKALSTGTQGKQNKTSEQGRHIKDRHRQGKRV